MRMFGLRWWEEKKKEQEVGEATVRVWLPRTRMPRECARALMQGDRSDREAEYVLE